MGESKNTKCKIKIAKLEAVKNLEEKKMDILWRLEVYENGFNKKKTYMKKRQ